MREKRGELGDRNCRRRRPPRPLESWHSCLSPANGANREGSGHRLFISLYPCSKGQSGVTPNPAPSESPPPSFREAPAASIARSLVLFPTLVSAHSTPVSWNVLFSESSYASSETLLWNLLSIKSSRDPGSRQLVLLSQWPRSPISSCSPTRPWVSPLWFPQTFTEPAKTGFGVRPSLIKYWLPRPSAWLWTG